RKVFIGLDLSAQIDTTCVCLIFPPIDAKEEVYTIYPRIYTPAGLVHEKERRDRRPWLMWRDAGEVICPPGDVIRTEDIIADIKKDLEDYDVKALIYDRWGTKLVEPILWTMGFDNPLKKKLPTGFQGDARHKQIEMCRRPAIPMGQGFYDMPEAIRLMEEYCILKRINHGGHRALAFQIFNVLLVTDESNNPKFSKKRSGAHIDAAVAASMALYWAQRLNPKGSIYEGRGLTVI
ncbi:unnamed protein product, partial [marine sediment metagenome]